MFCRRIYEINLAYSGENNAWFHRDEYLCTFPAMINSWRERWSTNVPEVPDNFPFGFVQIGTNYTSTNDRPDFPVIRWHQTSDYGYVPNQVLEVRPVFDCMNNNGCVGIA